MKNLVKICRINIADLIIKYFRVAKPKMHGQSTYEFISGSVPMLLICSLHYEPEQLSLFLIKTICQSHFFSPMNFNEISVPVPWIRMLENRVVMYKCYILCSFYLCIPFTMSKAALGEYKNYLTIFVHPVKESHFHVWIVFPIFLYVSKFS